MSYVLALIAVVVTVPAALVFQRATTEEPVKPHPAPHARHDVVWSDRVFLDRAIATRWFTQHGVQYRVWASRHPRAAQTLDRARKS